MAPGLAAGGADEVLHREGLHSSEGVRGAPLRPDARIRLELAADWCRSKVPNQELRNPHQDPRVLAASQARNGAKSRQEPTSRAPPETFKTTAPLVTSPARSAAAGGMYPHGATGHSSFQRERTMADCMSWMQSGCGRKMEDFSQIFDAGEIDESGGKQMTVDGDASSN